MIRNQIKTSKILYKKTLPFITLYFLFCLLDTCYDIPTSEKNDFFFLEERSSSDSSGNITVLRNIATERTRYRRNLIMIYTWGDKLVLSEGNTLLRLLIQSYRRVSVSDTNILIFCVDCFSDEESNLAWFDKYEVRILKIPHYVFDSSLTYKAQRYAEFRLIAWEWYLREHRSEYDQVIHTDTDVLFQRDPFGPGCLRGISGLHVFEENPIIRLGECNIHKAQIQGCDVFGKTGIQIIDEIKHRGRLCVGYVQGDSDSMLQYLSIMAKELDRSLQCYDQGLLNILVWQRILVREGVSRVYIWSNFHGPLKTLDVGYFRDRSGFAYNNDGYPYCILHQYKGSRSPEFQLMWETIVSIPRGKALPDAALPSSWDPISKSIRSEDFNRSLGPHGDSISFPRLPVPKSIYTPMPDNRYDHGIHYSVQLMLDSGVNIPASLDPPKLKVLGIDQHAGTFPYDVWGYTTTQLKV